jgi:tetratricopeptide (TPR) repeat protein
MTPAHTTTLASRLAEQNKLPEAVTAYNKAVEIDPNDASAYYNMGITLVKQKKLDEAVTAYHKAIETRPE